MYLVLHYCDFFCLKYVLVVQYVPSIFVSSKVIIHEKQYNIVH